MKDSLRGDPLTKGKVKRSCRDPRIRQGTADKLKEIN